MADHIKVCAISGQALDSHDPIIQTAKGAYGVKAHLHKTLTEESRAEIEARLFEASDDSHNNTEHSDDGKRPQGRNHRNSKDDNA